MRWHARKQLFPLGVHFGRILEKKVAKKSSPWPFEFGSETYADWSAPLESALRSEQTKLACLHGASDWVGKNWRRWPS